MFRKEVPGTFLRSIALVGAKNNPVTYLPGNLLGRNLIPTTPLRVV